MEIVRAQPFFSKKSHILRDQLEEYVKGFPATKAHRQIIANKYTQMRPESNNSIRVLNDHASETSLVEKKRESSSVNPASEKRHLKLAGGVDIKLPDEELPVDSKRLRKAIKNALLKNDNNPEKIDIQSIMREQVRIHKHISDFKQERQKHKGSNENGNYFSSRIVKKIAEDHIHQSLKQIQAENFSITGTFQADADYSMYNSKSQDRLTKKPTKFQ